METTKEEMRTPTNADIRRFFFLSMDKKFNVTTFEFRTEFGGTLHHFEAQFVDLKDFEVLCTNTKDAFAKYERGNALTSLLYDSCFSDVEAFAVACRNALGDNLETLPLAGSIFVNGQCVDEILSDLEEQDNDEKQLTTEVKKMKVTLHLLTQLVTEMCIKHPDFHRS